MQHCISRTLTCSAVARSAKWYIVYKMTFHCYQHSLLRAPRLVILSQTTYTKFSHHGNTKTTYDMIVTNIKSDIVFCEVAVMVTFSSLSHEQPRSRWDIFSRTCHPVISNVACTTSSRYDHSELSWLLEKKQHPHHSWFCSRVVNKLHISTRSQWQAGQECLWCHQGHSTIVSLSNRIIFCTAVHQLTTF